MPELHPQFIVDTHMRKQSVILPYSEWQTILELLDELDAIQAYKNSKQSNDPFIPFEQAVHELNLNHDL